MSKKVIVTNISEKATEKTVKDFFLFCGKIKDFELIKEESSDTQIAYVTFERDTAAKTALMLSSAVIGESQIVVKSADDSQSDDSDGGDCGPEEKPILAEILAAGYSLQDTLLDKGMEIDSKYGISNVFKQYLSLIQDNLKNLDQKYQVTDAVAIRATNINDKYSVVNGAKYVMDTAHNKVNTFLETPAGKILWGYLFETQKQVMLARRIADEKKQEKNFNPMPSHSHSNVQEATSD